MKEARFKDTIKFSETAQTYLKTGKYTQATVGTPAYKEFWDKEIERCKNGYKIGKIRITGRHYFYLNFCLIKKVDFDEKGRATKTSHKKQFPNFYDADYEFFWLKEIAKWGISEKELKELNLESKPLDLDGSKNLILAKARRKGYSYKNAALALYEYTFEPNSLTLILASDKKYLFGGRATMDMIRIMSDFINDNVPGLKRSRLTSTKDNLKSGFVEDGIEKGYLSEILAISMKDDPDKARGKDCSLIIFEEAGTFSNLEDTYNSTYPSITAGIYITGQMIIFGTGGDMEGSTIDFEKMFNDPETFKMLRFENIWDPTDGNKVCGWFHPAYMNVEGFMDKEGNSFTEKALEYYVEKRELLKKNSKDKIAITQYIIEFPFTPKEVFSIKTGSIFPVAELLQQVNHIEANTNIDTLGIRGYMTTDVDGKIKFNKDDDLKEVEFPIKSGADTEGCVVIYEQPIQTPPYGLYIAGLDPYAQDITQNSSSLGSFFIYKRSMVGQSTGDRIVAEYTGRPQSIKEYNETVRKLLLYYNAICLHENQINNIVEYFTNKNCLYLLADTPTCLKSTINSTVRRGKGQHMTKDIKLELEVYVRDWLNELNSEGIPNLKFIYSKPLLNELIRYNSEGNFDRVISLMMCILYKIQLTKITVDARKEKKIDPWFERMESKIKTVSNKFNFGY